MWWILLTILVLSIPFIVSLIMANDSDRWVPVIGSGAVAFVVTMFAYGLGHDEIVDDRYSENREFFVLSDSVFQEKINSLTTVLDIYKTDNSQDGTAARIRKDLVMFKNVWQMKKDSAYLKQAEEVSTAKYNKIFPLSLLATLGWFVVTIFLLPKLVFYIYDGYEKDLEKRETEDLKLQLWRPPHELHPLIPYWVEGDSLLVVQKAYQDFTDSRNVDKIFGRNDRQIYSSECDPATFISFSEVGILVKLKSGEVLRVPAITVKSNDTFEKNRKGDILKKMDDESMYKTKLKILAEDSLMGSGRGVDRNS